MDAKPILKQVLRENPTWEAQATCIQADPELFYAESAQGINEARKVCVDCPVITECFARAVLKGEQYGVWGGHTASERPSLRRPVYREMSRAALSAAVRKRIRP